MENPIHICRTCKRKKIVSENLKVCADCIKENRNNILQEIAKVHNRSRQKFHLEPAIPKGLGESCKICANECSIQEDRFGFCGLRTNKSGKIVSIAGTAKRGILDWYFDTLPTNCVADWICDGTKHPGMKNLAVFYRSCSFNCLFCQNWHFKETQITNRKTLSAEELANSIDNRTFCICYFGGDPATQLPHALATSRYIRNKRKDIRICFETNGSMDRNLLRLAVELCLESGGCIKFDLKAFNENLHYALCSVSNKTTLKNFEFVAKYIGKRQDPPLLIASTLLVPGYIDEEEIYNIASFIASIDKTIPYSLLGFYPIFYLQDLPTTSKTQAEKSLKAAKNAGLVKVHIGNRHLLSASDLW
ncbi:MAG: radical SAM protein [Elusimicrobiota bacterium]|nr:radical SAM protein [Elusimicrobiota bacterium]